MKIFFRICEWGLGHATRCLPLLKALARENYEVVIFSSGEVLDILKSELKDFGNFEFVEIPKIFEFKEGSIVKNLTVSSAKIGLRMRKEHRICEKYCLRYKPKIIVSDSVYPFFNKRCKNIFITHQLRFYRVYFSEILNKILLTKFRKIIVPDFEDPNNNLSGILSHDLIFFKKEKACYVGHLSNLEPKKTTEPKLDIFCICSGPKKYREKFAELLESKLSNLDKKVIITGGSKNKDLRNVRVFRYLSSENFLRYLCQANLIISRSGYSTLMDLAELEKKALLVPTPSQLEQEYLARYHKSKGNFNSISEKELKKASLKELSELVEEATNFKGFKPKTKTKENVKKALEIIL